jgi:hypothetical protein
MPVRGQIMQVEDNAERVGVLWRSRGEEFLAEQAAELAADVERLRGIYAGEAVAEPPAKSKRRGRRESSTPDSTIDLRDEDVSGMVCSRHGTHEAATRCSRCRDVFCSACIVRPEATNGEPLCTGCALVMAGVTHRRARPLVAPGRER